MNILSNLIVITYILSLLKVKYSFSIYDYSKNTRYLGTKNTIIDKNYYTLESKSINSGKIELKLKRSEKNHFKDFNPTQLKLVNLVNLEIIFVSKNTFQFIFRDGENQRFEQPYEELFPYHKNKIPIENDFDFKLNNLGLDYDFKITENPFSLEVSRKSTKEVVFSTNNHDFFFGENYGEFTSELPTANLFGLGERTTTFRLKSGIYTLYNKDLYGEIEDGKGKGKNRYGSHPMYLMREKTGNYHITYLRNTFPMDVILDFPNGNKNTRRMKIGKKNLITYKVAGGIFDFSIFFGDENPENSIKLYHNFLGGWSLTPFWSLGFHQCRWGYKNLNYIKEVLKGYADNSIPLDTIWMDIDYMNDYQPFTVDENRYNLNEFKSVLENYGKKFVMIIEPTIGVKHSDFWLLREGENLDLFVKNSYNKNLINRVWPGRSYFIDYFNKNAEDYWKKALEDLHKKLNFSGIWLDMNEIAAFSLGQVNWNADTISCNDYKNYIYLPGSKPFETATICPNALHKSGQYEHIAVHNYYPNQQAKLTYKFLEGFFSDMFPFILTRANAPGMGRYSAKWSGDNYGNEEFLKFSISEVLSMNLFGIPNTGADICGFGYDTPEYLCARWYQMGSLYPFSRSHSHMDYHRKEPFMMGKMLLETTRKSLNFRYSILKYYYSLMMRKNYSGTIFRPIFFEFFDDELALSDYVIENTFMIGDSLIVVPNLNSNEVYISNGYFPAGSWFDLRKNLKVEKTYESNGELVKVSTELYEMPAVFLRGGKIIFRNRVNENNNIKKVNSTNDLDNDFDLYIAFNTVEFLKSEKETFIAEGFIPALNNYESKKSVSKCVEQNCFIEVIATLNKNKKDLTILFKKASFYDNSFKNITISNIYILGLQIQIKDILDFSNKNYQYNNLNKDTILIGLNDTSSNNSNNLITLERENIEVILRFK
jgi:alpha-glucosidase (family GH31 glycosyl hydrolase)